MSMCDDRLTTLSADERKALLKRLNAKAVQAKMDLHDLAEELPRDWQKILAVAQAAHAAHAALAAAKGEDNP